MRKDQGFDMLENADDRTIERLSEVPVLTEKEKERILKMSKDKLKRRYRTENIEAGVSGVETYRRPKWYSFAALAASLVLVCGIVGTGVLMNRNGMAPDENENKLPRRLLRLPRSRERQLPALLLLQKPRRKLLPQTRTIQSIQ